MGQHGPPQPCERPLKAQKRGDRRRNTAARNACLVGPCAPVKVTLTEPFIWCREAVMWHWSSRTGMCLLYCDERPSRLVQRGSWTQSPPTPPGYRAGWIRAGWDSRWVLFE